jgi:hypothetical protein
MPDQNDPILTIRIPQSSWRGIVNGIEKWAGMSQFDPDLEILADYEIVDPPEVAAQNRDIRAQAAVEYAEDDE